MFFVFPRISSVMLLIALAIYAALGLGCLNNMGVVGEVAWSWMDGRSSLHQPPDLPSDHWGPLVASSTRPMAALQLGDFSLPLLINTYTSGIADWPARILSAFGASYDATMFFHYALGGLFIFLVHRFVRIHGSNIAASAVALVLATDWVFVFLRRTLGGTEILLHASLLLCLWALWSRRWAGGRHGLSAFALGVGLGLAAKLTFLLSLVALCATALLLRSDKPDLRPPLPTRWLPVAICLAVPLLPATIGWAHHLVADLAALPTHDHLQMQFDRVWRTLQGQNQAPRESAGVLFTWLSNPMAFLSIAWGADAPDAWSGFRLLGFVLVGGGVMQAWQHRDPTPRIALIRFCSLFLVLQVSLIWLVARDIHHLAIATPTLAIVTGLGLEQLAAGFTPNRSIRRALWVGLGCIPWVCVGIASIVATDDKLRTIERPTVSRNGQQDLSRMLQTNAVQKVVTLDYETAGALDVLLPQTDFIHGWTSIARQQQNALAELMAMARGHHLLVIPKAAPWRYNLRPQEQDLDSAAAQAGVDWVAVDRLPDDGAVLYAVDSQMGQP